ncbi:hypothetical protein I551_5056 [Mycobacterium ulcerans str. Harvey]|uniref:Uncharacterized protein n=1 Tax=Mycobacterium ulcerans str. Harvey TaxID=1299332 RepID=A0ABP3AC97_MYCUL|nr:hypothetical protein I551_5056 [Mycobacterium ulcerans str. Harvey]
MPQRRDRILWPRQGAIGAKQCAPSSEARLAALPASRPALRTLSSSVSP